MVTRHEVRAENLVFDCWAADLQSRHPYTKTHFSENGFTIFDVGSRHIEGIKAFFDPSLETVYRKDDVSNDFHQTPVSDDFVEKYNRTHKFYKPPAAEAQSVLEDYLKSIDIEKEIGSPFRIVSARSCAIISQYQVGPTSWHFDGGPRFLRKILVYPNVLNSENGTLELYSRKGKKTVLNGGPYAVLCDVSVLKHRGVPGSDKNVVRPMLEITICPSDKTDYSLRFAGQAAREMKLPQEIPEHFHALSNTLKGKKLTGTPQTPSGIIYKLNRRFGFLRDTHWRYISNQSKNLVIGKADLYDGWVNIDPDNEYNIGAMVDPTKFKLPVGARTIDKAYVPRFFDDLPAADISQVLKDISRVLSPHGDLVIKSSNPVRKKELKELLLSSGFIIVSSSALTTLKFLNIPSILQGFRNSYYFHAKLLK